MAEDNLSNNEIASLLIKEYDAMRTELRDYIKRYYSSIVIVQSIIFATIFTAAKENLSWLYIFIPGLVMGFAALMSMITLFISQQASYLKLIERRLNNICGKEYFIWESKYADQSLKRDSGLLFSPLITIIYIFLALPLILAVVVSVRNGYYFISDAYSEWLTWFVVYATFSLASIVIFPLTNKIVRKKCRKYNDTLTTNNFTTRNFGEHLTIDGYGGTFAKLNDKNLVHHCLEELPGLLNMKKLCKPLVYYAEDNHLKDPGGWSGFVIVAESHISIHTFPARCFLSADVYTCRNGLDQDFMTSYFKDKFGLQDVETHFLKRGTRYPVCNIVHKAKQ